MKPDDAAPISLEGTTCLVTGACGGIGQATAEHFAALGARVLVTDVADSFQGDCAHEYRQIDITDQAGLDVLADWVSAERPQVLFNNAAVFDMGSNVVMCLAQDPVTLSSFRFTFMFEHGPRSCNHVQPVLSSHMHVFTPP